MIFSGNRDTPRYPNAGQAFPGSCEWGSSMPAWLEILLDVGGFAGFIAIASWRRSPRKNGKPAQR
jgi:hypothetical protein